MRACDASLMILLTANLLTVAFAKATICEVSLKSYVKRRGIVRKILYLPCVLEEQVHGPPLYWR